jgi:hypothetical protein
MFWHRIIHNTTEKVILNRSQEREKKKQKKGTTHFKIFVSEGNNLAGTSIPGQVSEDALEI